MSEGERPPAPAALDLLGNHRIAVRREQRSTEPSTQLRAGESRTWTYPVPPGPGAVTVAVRYKFFFLEPDEGAVEVHGKTLAF